MQAQGKYVEPQKRPQACLAFVGFGIPTARYIFSGLIGPVPYFLQCITKGGEMKLARIGRRFVVMRQGRVFIVESLSEAITILKWSCKNG